jgi:oligoribonuclease
MNKLLWVDLETTGLDEKTCAILEVAAIITTQDLKVIDRFTLVVHQEPEVLAGMNEWCKNQHTKSGLVEEVKMSFITIDKADEILAEFVTKHIGKDAVLYGNTITFDQRFIKAHMPKTTALLHYRTVDVTAFKRYFTDRYEIQEYKKKEAHRGLDDIMESIAELQYYSKFINVETEEWLRL